MALCATRRSRADRLIIIAHSSLYFEIKMRQWSPTRMQIQERRVKTEFDIGFLNYGESI